MKTIIASIARLIVGTSFALGLPSTIQAQGPPAGLVPISASDALHFSPNYYSLQKLSSWPPLPFNWLSEAQLYAAPSSGTNAVFVDDLAIDYVQRAAAAQVLRLARRAAANDGPSVPVDDVGGSGDDFGGGIDYSARVYTTNDLFLEITNVAVGLAYLNLHNATNQVYAIWCATNVLGSWNVEAEVWPTNQDVIPFTVPTLERQNLFLRAEDWTGVDSDGDGIPDWWIWQYFGNLSETATNLDSQGNSLLYDFNNALDPNVIAFTLSATNYVNTATVPVQITLLAGAPSYYAVLVNDSNQADANWLAYTGPNITVNLGSTDGVYTVAVCLRGLPQSAQQTWQTVQLTRDTVGPTVVITSPAVNITAQPTIQLQGYATKPLSTVTYDVSNALGVLSSLTGFVKSQYLDPALFAFTTNWIQCYDIDLASGANTITLRVTDWAGNTTTTNFSITLDYSTATNPLIQVTWPPDGSQICAGSFTCRGTLDDPTATVTAQITDTNGDISVVTGLVERNGNFWLENLPLSSGANVLTLAVTNAAGLGSVSNLTLGQGALKLAVSLPPPEQLWQPTVDVTGTVSDTSCAVWVNGVQGVNNGDGTWYALSVPSAAGGVASFDAAAQSGGTAFVNNTNTDKPAQIVVTRYELDWTRSFTPKIGSGSGPQPNMVAVAAGSEHYHLLWQEDVGTTAYDAVTRGNVSCTTNYNWQADECILNLRSPSTNGVATNTCSTNIDLVGPPSIGLEHCKVATNWTDSSGSNTYTRTADTVLTLLTGGKGQLHQQRLFQISGSAFAITNWAMLAGYGVPPTQVQMGGLGCLGTDSNLWYVLQENTTNAITPRVLGTLNPDYYIFSAAQTKCPLSVTANGTALSNDVVAAGATFSVG